MEVTAFIIELSAEVVKGMQGGNECWMKNNGKTRGELWKGWCGVKEIEIDRSANINASEYSQSPLS